MPSRRLSALATSLFRRPSWWFAVLLAVFGMVETFAYIARVRGVASKDDWLVASEIVREQFRARDLVVSVPGWTSPVMREAVGDLVSFEMAGFSDLAPFERLWVLSVRGASSPLAPSRAPDFDALRGPIRVSRWDLGETTVRAQLADRLASATVEVVRGDGARVPCRHERGRMTEGGGLGRGPMKPSDRFACPAEAWVGRTINEDLSLAPRDCIYQPALGREPLRVTIPDVELGDRFVFYGGLYAEAERMEDHPPIEVVVRVDGEELGRLTHRDGEGWTRHEWPTGAGRGAVSVEVTSETSDRRMFCWSATTRGSRRAEGE